MKSLAENCVGNGASDNEIALGEPDTHNALREKIRVIPNNLQKFMAVRVGRVQFLDSMQFAKSSLAELKSTFTPAVIIHVDASKRA